MSTAAELFSYNRENFKFNKEQRQKNLYMQQNMRVRQVLLYRQDLKDLFELTVGKMDSYMMVDVLMLGISAEMYYKGGAPLMVPGWLFWCWGISLAGAFFFLLFSTWLALHASVLSQTYMARCLSQWLRLPIPSIEEVDVGSARLEEYESNTFLDFVRPPVLLSMGKKMGNEDVVDSDGLRKRGSVMDHPVSKDLSTHWTEFLDHFNLFNSLHHKWRSHEAYARVSMCAGTNHLLSAFTYFALAYYSIEYQNPWIGTVFVLLATLAQLIHLRMSLNLSQKEHYIQTTLVSVPPICLAVSAALSSASVDHTTGTVTVPNTAVAIAIVGFVFQFAWVVFFLVQTKHDSQQLPMKFSTVWCLDILGVGIETIRDIEEPRVDFPGFVDSVGTGNVDPKLRPFNTYDLSMLRSQKRSDEQTSAVKSNSSPSQDIVDSCCLLEKKLHHQFALWLKNANELTTDELALLQELQDTFYSKLEIFKKFLPIVNAINQANKSHVASTEKNNPDGVTTPDSETWIRINHETNAGVSAPFLLNMETGEIKPDEEDLCANNKEQESFNSDVEHFLFNLNADVNKFQDYVNKLEYTYYREKSVAKHRNPKSPSWPFELFRAGGVLILIAWISAFVETILHWNGIS